MGRALSSGFWGVVTRSALIQCNFLQATCSPSLAREERPVNKPKSKTRKEAVFIGWGTLLTFFRKGVLVDKFVDNNSLLEQENVII
jgi:hypothetical protein